jgi:hypothetical protein
MRVVLAVAIGIGGLFMTDKLPSIEGYSFVMKAEARIGRPRTPMSYAGVARRTTRRAVGYGVGYGAAMGATAYGTSDCAQAANSYGQVYLQCP